MSEVRMSLEEYNQMVQENNFYREIVEAITDIKCNRYDLDSYRDGGTRYISICAESLDLSSRSMKAFQNIINTKIQEIINSEGLKDCTYDPNVPIRVDYSYLCRKDDVDGD